MKAVMISIKPKYVELIANGQKTIEVRKTRPKIDTPFKCYIYCTFPKKPVYTLWLNRGKENRFLADGKVIGEFVCDNIYPIKNQGSSFVVANATQGETNVIARQSCLDYDDMIGYFGDKDGYAWHISNLVIYEKPKELSEFIRPCDRFLDCITCKRLVRNDYLSCDNKITRPPQSWQFVEEKE